MNTFKQRETYISYTRGSATGELTAFKGSEAPPIQGAESQVEED